MVDVEKKIEYKVERKNGAADDMDNAADKMKAGAKAMGERITDPERDFGTEYNVEKARERLD
jgi:hypothetical protein